MSDAAIVEPKKVKKDRFGREVGEKTTSARVYRYGALQPIEVDAVRDQLRLAHKYRNKLVELERERRRKVDELLARMSPELAALEAKIGAPARDADPETGAAAAPATGLVLAYEQAEAEVLRERSINRDASKKSTSPAAQALKERRAALKEARDERKKLRAALFKDPGWKEANATIELNHKVAHKAARAECGCYWGTYNQVEAAAGSFRTGAPPEFRGWRDRRDKLGVQVQGGLTVPELLGGDDTQLRLVHEPRPESKCDGCMARARRQRRGQPEPVGARPCTCASMKSSKRREERKHATLWFRIGSTGRAPLWARVPVVIHRPLPDDAVIKEAHLIRREVGVHEQWSVHFVLSRESWAPGDQANEGVVGVDVGWRLMPDGALRVATWSGSNGAEGEIALPAWWLAEHERVSKIRSERDRLLDQARVPVQEWFMVQDKESLPDELKAAAATIHLWKSAGRFRALCSTWNKARTSRDGEERVLEAFSAWRSRDLHLLAFESHLRQQLQASRTDLYRVSAARLSRLYGTAVFEKMDLRRWQVLPPAEDGFAHEDRAMRANARTACISELRQCFKNRMRKFEQVDPKDTTAKCSGCGHVATEWKNRVRLVHACVKCGQALDQDLNASRNLLATSAEQPAWSKKPLERWSYTAGPNTRRRETQARWDAERKKE